MASSAEHAKLYGKLRASLLARHFAFSRYFRVNYLSLENSLGSLHRADPPSTEPPTQDDLELASCFNWMRIMPGTYKDAAGLNDLGNTDPGQEEAERWRVSGHVRENPLMFSGQLLTCLAIEHHFGVSEALPIIREALRSIGSMYKFKDTDHFKGYIIRWDPITDDRWVTEKQDGQSRPRYCCDYLFGEDREYLYCTPFNHPSYIPPTPNDFNDPEKWCTTERVETNPNNAQTLAACARYSCLERHRTWEPSMDELVGLIAGYMIVFELVEDQEVRDAVREQVDDLGDYLAEHGYMLVRPLGGFTARGASGLLPAMEVPFGRVFARITGNAYASRSTFEEACEKAGTWACLAGDMRAWTVTGALVGVLLGALLYLFSWSVPWVLRVFNEHDRAELVDLIRDHFGTTIGFYLTRALGINSKGGCFDVWDENARGEFAGAYLLKAGQSPDWAFRVFMRLIRIGDPQKGFAVGFAPFVGLSSYRDPDTLVVAEEYRAWYRARRDAFRDAQGEGSRTGFANAVAALLGAQEAEAELSAYLDTTYDNFNANGEDLRLLDAVYKDAVVGVQEDVFRRFPQDNTQNALEYMVCLALSWLHYEDQRNAGVSAGDIRVPGFPPGPTSTWLSRPTVPSAVPQKVNVPALVRCDITGEQPVDLFEGIPEGPLFEEEGFPEGPSESARLRDECREKGSVPPPDLGEILAEEVHTFTVREDQYDVDTSIYLFLHDSVSFEATGSIWAGVWLTGSNGPEGWETWITHDTEYPLHEGEQAHPFALLYKLAEERVTDVIGGGTLRGFPGDYHYLGNGAGAGFVYPFNNPRRLFLRINDNTPGNGWGSFTCTVRVRRVKR